jgi:hypothetical protein
MHLHVSICPHLPVIFCDFKSKHIVLTRTKNTVKLGYNELGYSELPVITNKFSPFFSPKSMFRP